MRTMGLSTWRVARSRLLLAMILTVTGTAVQAAGFRPSGSGGAPGGP